MEKDIDRALLLAKLGSTFGYPASLYIQAKCMLKQLAASSENLANIEMVSACAVERSYAPAFSIVGSLNEGKNDIYAAIQYYRKGAALGCKEALQSLRRLKRSIDRKKPAATSRTVSIVSNLFVSPPLPAAPLEVLSASSCRSTIV